MNAAYVSALAALAGSAIGALASLGTTWLTQRFQDRVQRHAQESARRERLYGEFIDEASKLYADALVRRLDGPARLVTLYAIMSKLSLFASTAVIDQAHAVMRRVLDTHERPEEDAAAVLDEIAHHPLDILRDFAEAARKDLRD